MPLRWLVLPRPRGLCALNDLSQRFQSDSGSSSSLLKNIPVFAVGQITSIKKRRLTPDTRGGSRVCHERGVGCGGRRSVGCAMNSRAERTAQMRTAERCAVLWHPLLMSSRQRFCEPNRVSLNRQSVGDEFLFVTVADRLAVQRTRFGSQNLCRLDISNGCQNHTTSPYASAPFVCARVHRAPNASASTASHPRS